MNKIICFKQDTKERKQWFKAASFAHPAKMHLSLQIYLIEHYTKPGDTILDPMAGSGTILIACALGRNMILVELEEKFVKMQQDNYEKIKSLGPMLGCQMGKAVILQGDARNLDGLLADNILFSPPYAEALSGGGIAKYGHFSDPKLAQRAYSAENMNIQKQIKRVKEGKAKMKRPDVFTSEGNKAAKGYFEGNYSHNPHNIGNLPYGEISAVISSPPYAESQIGDNRKKHHPTISGIKSNGKHRGGSLINKFENTQENPNNIGNLSYGDVDAAIFSPPYADISHSQGDSPMQRDIIAKKKTWAGQEYSDNPENIGNLKSKNYLQAMLQVYHQCHRVLREKGLMVLVVKNFIRDKKVIRLDLDTIKICEKAGFKLKETLQRKLTQQSFWRIIYHRKYPDVPPIEYEDILIFQRQT